MAEFEPILGRYLALDCGGVRYRLYVEEAGQGIPLLCLHTAGADSRQYRHLLCDAEVTRRFRVIAFDLPWHGRSNPPERCCKVALLSGEYDYSCTPAMTEAVAQAIPGARFRLMQGMGHFPMIENYPAFREYLLPELEMMAR